MQKKSKQLNKINNLVHQGQLSVAFKLLKKQIKSQSNAEIWVKLASLCASSGLNNESLNCCQRAIQLDSECALAYSYLGKIYVTAGDKQKALNATNKAIQLKDDDALIQFHCGYVLYMMEKFDDALKHFLISLDIDPANAMAHAMAGSCYQAIADTGSLVRHFEASLELNPELVDSMVRLGSHYQALGEFDAAEVYFDRALAILPDTQLLLDKKANFLATTGRKQEAYAIVRGLIDTQNYSSLTLNIYAGLCSKYGSVDECIELSEKLLSRSGINDSDRRNLGFALGRLYDSAGDYDLAMEKYNIANKLFYGRFNVQSHIEFTSKIIDVYSRIFYNNFPKVNEFNKKPIFIIGMPRSGTSLVEQILSQHTKVYAGGELPYINDIMKRLSNAEFNKQVDMGFIKSLSESDMSALAQEYINRINVLSDGEERVTDKMPSNYNHLGLISRMFPDAKILHCKRDPRDICLSIYFQNFGAMQPFSSSLIDIASVYLEYDRLMHHWADALNIQMYEVRYEDLIADFEGRAKDLVKYCELEWDDDCLNFYKSKRKVATASFDQVNKPIYKNSLARWKNYEKHLTELEEMLKPVL